MKLFLVAGPPSAGKTSIIRWVIKDLSQIMKISYVKMDVVKAYEDVELKEEFGIDTTKVYTADLCPDHAEVMVLNDVYNWADKNGSDLLIIESAGLCLRCSPFLNQGIGVIAFNLTSGIHTIEKMQAIISFADIAVLTKSDLVSQAEREIYIRRLQDAHPQIKIIDTNALQGTMLKQLSDIINVSDDIDIESVELKGNPPLGTCTICIGSKKIGWHNHYGVVRKISGNITEYLYRGD